MKVSPIGLYPPSKQQQSFQGFKIAQSENYQATKKVIQKFPDAQRNFYNRSLKWVINHIIATNMDVTIHEGHNCPKFLEELKEDICVDNWYVDLYNKTVTKLFGKEKVHSVDVFIEPNYYTCHNAELKRPVKYNVPALNISGDYIDDKGLVDFDYPLYPRSNDPYYRNQKGYMDLPSYDMILEIKKSIFKHIIGSNKDLDYWTEINRHFYEVNKKAEI